MPARILRRPRAEEDAEGFANHIIFYIVRKDVIEAV